MNPDSSAVYWAGDLKAAPQNPHTTAVTLLNYKSEPDETGGVVVYDDSVERPNFAQGWGPSMNIYDTLGWGPSDSIPAIGRHRRCTRGGIPWLSPGNTLCRATGVLL